MQKRQNNQDKDMGKNLEKLVTLSENSLIISLAQQNIPHQVIRKIAGVDMSRVTGLLRGIKLTKRV